MNVLAVAFGGALGASARYGIGCISIKGNFPFMTFIVNVVGAILIGLIVGMMVSKEDELNPNLIIFAKVGVCGGFTTFSTFSLEVLDMIEDNHVFLGILYAVISVITCVAGVWLGRKLVV